MAKELKPRNEMDPRWQWRLDHIFATEEAYEQGRREGLAMWQAQERAIRTLTTGLDT